MSNIGKQYIKIPKGIIINIKNNKISVQGNKGILTRFIPENIILIQKNSYIYFLPYNYLNQNKNQNYNNSNWGTIQKTIKNMIKGVYQGFNVKLQLVGIGYKAYIENQELILKLGFSHLINFKIPKNIKILLLKPTLILIQGIDYEYVTKIASKIRSFKTPEPYKGKGIRYINEILIKKEGKKK